MRYKLDTDEGFILQRDNPPLDIDLTDISTSTKIENLSVTNSNNAVNSDVYTILSSDLANINITLTQPKSGYEGRYVIEIEKDNIPNVQSIKWPKNITWEGNVKPNILDFTEYGYDYWLVTIENGYLGSHKRYWGKPHDYSQDYLTFEAVENTTFQFTKAGLSYSLDNGDTWTSLAANTATPTVNAGNKILFKGEMTPSSSNPYGIGTFSSTGKYNAMGNIMSLLYGDNFIGQTDLTGKNDAFYSLFASNNHLVDVSNLTLPATTLANFCYFNMFYRCTSLTTAPELPATTLANQCYQSMFNGCTSLTTAPELPATTLASNCYDNMFYGCTSLTTAPELPATTLTNYCYNSMFWSCTSLTTAPELPATTLAGSCYSYMFNYCTSLTTAPELPATTLVNNCYNQMFKNCTSLTTAPELPATTLVNNCYIGMFQGCRKLNYIKAMFTTTPSSSYTGNWVSGVAASGTFVKNSAATWNVTGADGVPTEWTVETASA